MSHIKIGKFLGVYFVLCFWIADGQAADTGANFNTKPKFNFHLISSLMKYRFVN